MIIPRIFHQKLYLLTAVDSMHLNVVSINQAEVKKKTPLYSNIYLNLHSFFHNVLRYNDLQTMHMYIGSN